MPGKLKVTGTSPMSKVRKSMRSKRYGLKVRKFRQPVHYYKRTVKISDITASFNTVGPVSQNIAGAYVLSLDSFPNFTEFQQLYDQYKIKGIKLSFVPSGNSAIYSTASGSVAQIGFSRFNSVLDFDDSTTPTAENQLLQYSSLKTTPGWATHKRYYVPRVKSALVDNAVTNTLVASGSQRPGWISTDRPDIEHYGLKVWCSAPINTATSAAITYSVYATAYIACKNVK